MDNTLQTRARELHEVAESLCRDFLQTMPEQFKRRAEALGGTTAVEITLRGGDARVAFVNRTDDGLCTILGAVAVA